MITKRLINGEYLLMYSVGQAAAAIDRTPKSIRRLESQGIIPKCYTRGETNGYRLYTEHELKIIKHICKKYQLQRGVKFPEKAAEEFKQMFASLHFGYDQNDSKYYPEECKHASVRNVDA